MSKPFVFSIWVVLFCHLALGSKKTCPPLVEGEATAVARTQFENDFPLHDSSLRAKFPRIHAQLLGLYQADHSILNFAQRGSPPVKATDLLDQMAEGSNAVSKSVQRIHHRVTKDLRTLETKLGRASRERNGADLLAKLRDQREDLVKLSDVLDMAYRLFRIAPADRGTPFGTGTQLKWERFSKQRQEMDGQLLASHEQLALVFPDLSQDFRWAWGLVRVAFCLPSLGRVLVKSSELGIRPLVVGGQGVDRYLTAKFTDENGRAAIAELRTLSRPVLFGSDEWAESLDAAEKLRSLDIQQRFKIHFVFTGGIDVKAKKVLESMDIAVHGPVVPSVDL